MKIGQTVYIVDVCRRFPPGDYHFSIATRMVISFDQETVIVKHYSDLYAMARSYVFDCPFQAANNVDRIMAEYDSQGEPKVKDSKEIAIFLEQFESDEAMVVEKKK